MLKLFKSIAILEGVSYIALFFNMIVIKPNFMGVYKKLLFPIGISHGLLFIAYIILALILREYKKWDIKTTLIILLASLLPFATFYIEKKYLRTT